MGACETTADKRYPHFDAIYFERRMNTKY